MPRAAPSELVRQPGHRPPRGGTGRARSHRPEKTYMFKRLKIFQADELVFDIDVLNLLFLKQILIWFSHMGGGRQEAWSLFHICNVRTMRIHRAAQPLYT